MADWRDVEPDASVRTAEPDTAKKQIPELRQGQPSWKRRLAATVTPIIEAGAMGAGEFVGGALGGAGGAVGGGVGAVPGAAAGSVIGAGIGQMGGEGAVKLMNHLLGLGYTPEQAKRTAMDAFVTGAEYSMGGQAFGKLLGKAAEYLPSRYAAKGAAKEIAKSREYSPFEQELIAKRAPEVESALTRLQAPSLPRSVTTGAARDVALENISRGTMGAEIAARKQATQELAEKSVRSQIPVVPKAADIARNKIEAFNQTIVVQATAKEAEINAARQQVVDRINTLRKQESEKAARLGKQASGRELAELEQKFATEFETKYGQSLRFPEPMTTPKQRIGEAIQSASERAEEMSASRFGSEVIGYNQPKFINAAPAPESNALSEFVAAEKPPVGFTPSSDPESKLAKMLGAGEGIEGIAKELPSMDYKTLREISTAAGKAQRSNAENKPVAAYFGRLKSAAETTIADMLETSGGKKLADEYRNLNKLFEAEQVGVFREGTLGNKILPYGKEFEHAKSAPGDIPQFFANADNIKDLIRGMGVDKLSRPAVDPMTVTAEQLVAARAETMRVHSKDELLSAGRKKAAELLKPYFEYELAAVYQSADGGRKGANAVATWLRNPKNAENLELLGIRKEFEGIAKKAIELESKLGTKGTIGSKLPEEMKKANKHTVVRDVLNLDDPLKIYNYVIGSGNTRQAVADVMRVSPSPVYRDAVKSLVRDGIEADIKLKGLNPFNPEMASTPDKVVASKKLRDILPQLYDKRQIQALKDFNTVTHALEDVETKGVRQTLEKTAAEKGEDAVRMIPMGYAGYWAKHGFLAALDKIGIKYGTNILTILDRAAVNPEYADALVKAYKTKDRRHLNFLMNKVEKELSFKDKLLRGIGKGYMAAEKPKESDYEEPDYQSWKDQEYKP